MLILSNYLQFYYKEWQHEVKLVESNEEIVENDKAVMFSCVVNFLIIKLIEFIEEEGVINVERVK